MRKSVRYLCGVVLLILVYIILKYLGVVGRLMGGSQNSQVNFAITAPGQVFEVPIEPNFRGTYRYSASLKIGGKSDKAYGFDQDALIKFVEKDCVTGEVFGQSTLSIALGPSISKTGHGRYGKNVKLPFFKRRKKLCLSATIESISVPPVEDLILSVWAINTRPCWGVECLLD